MKKVALCLFCFFQLGLLIIQSALAKDSTSFDPNYVAISANESSMPVGTIAIWSTSSALPDGWLECNGSPISSEYSDLIALVGNYTPNYQGMFLRGHGSQDFKQNNGSTIGETTTSHVSGELGEIQGDSIRNITGHLITSTEGGTGNSGAVYVMHTEGDGVSGSGGTHVWYGFNASRIVPTDTENRPVNTAVRYIIKAD